MFKKGDLTVGKYPAQIVECLEKREKSECYLAKVKKTELWVIIKGQKLGTGDFIQREYQMLSVIRHAGIPRVMDFVTERDYVYMIMPYYSGVTLEKLVLQHGAMDERTVMDIAKKICAIIYYLQERDVPILHNDMKPSNMLLKETGEVILLDFGLSCYEGEVREHVLFQGTLGYAAPECWHQKEELLTKATDIFAFGATLYHLLEGEHPRNHFGKFDLSDYKKRERWQEIINKCCTPEKQNRYRNAAEIFEVLQRMTFK